MTIEFWDSRTKEQKDAIRDYFISYGRELDNDEIIEFITGALSSLRILSDWYVVIHYNKQLAELDKLLYDLTRRVNSRLMYNFSKMQFDLYELCGVKHGDPYYAEMSTMVVEFLSKLNEQYETAEIEPVILGARQMMQFFEAMTSSFKLTADLPHNRCGLGETTVLIEVHCRDKSEFLSLYNSGMRITEPNALCWLYTLLNIEQTYYEATGDYKPFKNIRLGNGF